MSFETISQVSGENDYFSKIFQFELITVYICFSSTKCSKSKIGVGCLDPFYPIWAYFVNFLNNAVYM